MAQIGLCDTLRTFTLFQGLANTDLMQIVAQTRFNFGKLEAGQLLAKDGDPCTTLHLLLSGEVAMTMTANDHSYAVTEHLTAPQVITMDSLFGVTGYYHATISTTEPCATASIEQKDVITLITTYPIVRMNAMNALVIPHHRLQRKVWTAAPSSVRERITAFFRLHCSHPAGTKIVKIKMARLAEEVGESRLKVSQALNTLEEEGLITLSRGMITIPQLEKL